MRSHLRTRIIAVLATVAVLGGLVAASAASLDVTSASLTAFSDHSTIAAPPILTCDNFAKASKKGTAIDGRPVQLPSQCGSATWAVNTGTWRVNGGRATASGNHATATLATGLTNVSVEANFINANSNSRVGGVVLAHSGGTTNVRYLAAVLAGPNGVQLRFSNGTTVTTIATGTATYGSPARLRATLVISGGTGTVTISVNGTLVMTTTLTAAQVTLLSGNTRAGLYDHQGSVRFDDFLVTEAWPP